MRMNHLDSTSDAHQDEECPERIGKRGDDAIARNRHAMNRRVRDARSWRKARVASRHDSDVDPVRPQRRNQGLQLPLSAAEARIEALDEHPDTESSTRRLVRPVGRLF
jgi:hypothetical protein